MVVVLLDQGGEVIFPVCKDFACVVVFGLVHVPGVDVLVHHEDAVLVAGIEQPDRSRVVGGAESVVAVFFEEPHAAVLRLREGAGAQDAVVVVDAGALQDDVLAVQRDAFFRGPGESPDAEGVGRDIAAERHADFVERGILDAPELGVRDLDPGAPFERPADDGLALCHAGAVFKDLNACGAGGCGLHGHENDGLGPYGEGLYADAADRDIVLRAFPEPDRAVDARAGVPAAVRLVGVVGDDGDFIFPVNEKFIERNVKLGVAVGTRLRLFAVDRDLGIFVDGLELKDQLAVLELVRDRELFLVLVVAAREPADIALAHAVGGARLGDHGVVGERDGAGFAGP